MKKIFLYAGILVASFATVSCNEDFKDWEQPQSIPQGPDKDVVTAAANLLSNTIDYDATETSKVTLLTQSFITGVDAAQLVYSNLKINGVDIPCTSEDGNLIVALDDIKKACETFYHSKAHTTRLMECTVKASSLDDDGVAVSAELTIDAATVDSFAFQFKTPELPAIAYEDAYYYIGGYNGWNLAAPTPMEKNEDGTFSVILDIGDSEWFCFAPQSAVDNQDWNGLLRATSNGDTSTSGFFNEDSSSGNSFQCEKGGTFKFTISPKDWSFSYAPVEEIALPQMMYIVGSFPASDGWSKFVPLSQAFSQDGFYYGVVYLPSGSEFKINQDAGWKGNDKGYGQLTVTDDAGAGLSSADASNDAANIKVANGGWYNIIVKGKIANGALQYELITRKADVYIIGAALGGEWSLSDNGKFTAPDNEGAWTSPAFTGDGELRMFVDCGIDWWKTEFTIKTDGTLFYRNVDIPSNWAENVGADYSCQVSSGQKAYINFTFGIGRVE